MTKPSSRARLIEARTYGTRLRVLLQEAQAEQRIGGQSSPAIAAALTAAEDLERKIRYALDSIPDEPQPPETAA